MKKQENDPEAQGFDHRVDDNKIKADLSAPAFSITTLKSLFIRLSLSTSAEMAWVALIRLEVVKSLVFVFETS